VKAYFSKFLPLDRFRVNQGRLEHDEKLRQEMLALCHLGL